MPKKNKQIIIIILLAVVAGAVVLGMRTSSNTGSPDEYIAENSVPEESIAENTTEQSMEQSYVQEPPSAADHEEDQDGNDSEAKETEYIIDQLPWQEK